MAGQDRAAPGRYNGMHPIRWVPADAAALLDVGCNVGAFLSHCRAVYPALRLSGVEINGEALRQARAALPDADLHETGAEALPFADERFDCVTCIEVLEHIPAALRRPALAEVRRVLKPGGRLVLRVPHAGAFAFLDSNNLRFRAPGLHRLVIGRGLRDASYESKGAEVVWHHHFTKDELLRLLGDGWEVETWRTGGLFLFPLMDLALWPFYRTGRAAHPIGRALARIADFDLGCRYGPASFDILLVLRRQPEPDMARAERSGPCD